jgi:hypothetical protein
MALTPTLTVKLSCRIDLLIAGQGKQSVSKFLAQQIVELLPRAGNLLNHGKESGFPGRLKSSIIQAINKPERWTVQSRPDHLCNSHDKLLIIAQ